MVCTSKYEITIEVNKSILYLERSNDTIGKTGHSYGVIILPTEEKESIEKKEKVKDIVQSLVGAIPYTDKTL